MQIGLMDTWDRPMRARGLAAWALSALLLAFYVDVYFFSHLDVPARALGLDSKWTLYGALYTLAIVGGAARFLRTHGTTPYQARRTWSLVAVQVVLAFALPNVMKALGQPEVYLSYFWPLKLEYLFPDTLAALPSWAATWVVLGGLVAAPVAAVRFGKRWYCGWICGCGGLAETFGDPWRHLSDRSTRAWRIERVVQLTVLGLALATTALVLFAATPQGAPLAGAAGTVRSAYGFGVGAVFSGVLGVGLYPLMGTRVWCRFGCPMAALLGFAQRAGNFRVRVKRDMCIACGNCSAYCEMGIDVRAYAMRNEDVRRDACVGCGFCAHVCPRGVLRLEARPAAEGEKLEWHLDL